MIVAPFAADIDTSTTGYVTYTSFSAFPLFDDQMDDVASFIESHNGDDFFSPSRMMVAEWNGVPMSGGFTVSFHGIIMVQK